MMWCPARIRSIDAIDCRTAYDVSSTGKDSARKLRAAGKAVTDRPVARGACRTAGGNRDCMRPAQDARAAALALDLFPRREGLRRDDLDLQGNARGTGDAFHDRPAGSGRRADLQ